MPATTDPTTRRCGRCGHEFPRNAVHLLPVDRRFSRRACDTAATPTRSCTTNRIAA